MKKYIFGALIGISLATFSCKDDKLMYEYPFDKVYFKYTESDSITRKSFVYDPVEVVRDTVFINLQTIGKVTNYDREVKIVQRDTTAVGKITAIPNVHFVAFDSPEMKGKMVIPAGASKAKIPIILLKDISLESSEALLYVEILDNENFLQGLPGALKNRVVFSCMLSKPALWRNMQYYFGDYGQVKHQFLIDQTGFKWDEDFVNAFAIDGNYVQAMAINMRKRLEEFNAALKEQYPNDPSKQTLKEADGTVVKFGK